MLLLRRGEGDAARRIYEWLPSTLKSELAMVRLAADRGRMRDASVQIEQILQHPWTAYPAGVDDLLAIHKLLAYLTEQDVAAGGSTFNREVLDSRLAALRLYIDRTEDPDPPWDRIDCLLLQASVLCAG